MGKTAGDFFYSEELDYSFDGNVAEYRADGTKGGDVWYYSQNIVTENIAQSGFFPDGGSPNAPALPNQMTRTRDGRFTATFNTRQAGFDLTGNLLLPSHPILGYAMPGELQVETRPTLENRQATVLLELDVHYKEIYNDPSPDGQYRPRKLVIGISPYNVDETVTAKWAQSSYVTITYYAIGMVS